MNEPVPNIYDCESESESENLFVKVIIYFPKRFHHRCSTESLNTPLKLTIKTKNLFNVINTNNKAKIDHAQISL